jgi:glycosyltransferase involved in cell wall biosynthesis
MVIAAVTQSMACESGFYDIVVPAHNEASRLPPLLPTLKACGGVGSRVIVCDSASSDGTAEAAVDAGADTVLRLDRPGKGYAVVAGLQASAASAVFVCDADVAGLSEAWVGKLMRTVEAEDVSLARLVLGRPVRTAPVTALVARPLLRALGVELREPLGGLIGLRRASALQLHLPGGWGFDVSMSLSAVDSGERVPELESGEIRHRERPLDDYVGIAEEVVVAVLRARGLLAWDHSDCVQCAPAAAAVLSTTRAVVQTY